MLTLFVIGVPQSIQWNSQLLYSDLNSGLDRWPQAQYHLDPLGYSFEPILAHPVRPLEQYIRPIPYEKIGQLFQETFWNTALPKYGHRATRLGQEKAPLAQHRRRYYREKDVLRISGYVGKKLVRAIKEALRRVHLLMVSEYFMESLMDRVFPITVRKRWFHFAKRWEGQDQKFQTIKTTYKTRETEMDDSIKAVEDLVDKYGGEAAVPPEYDNFTSYQQALMVKLENAIDHFGISVLDMHKFLLDRVQETQIHVLEYLQSPPSSRSKIFKRYSRLRERLQEFQKTATEMNYKLEDTFAYPQALQLNDSRQQMIEKLMEYLTM
jgi:hypothetical protein